MLISKKSLLNVCFFVLSSVVANLSHLNGNELIDFIIKFGSQMAYKIDPTLTRPLEEGSEIELLGLDRVSAAIKNFYIKNGCLPIEAVFAVEKQLCKGKSFRECLEDYKKQYPKLSENFLASYAVAASMVKSSIDYRQPINFDLFSDLSRNEMLFASVGSSFLTLFLSSPTYKEDSVWRKKHFEKGATCMFFANLAYLPPEYRLPDSFESI